MYMPKNIRLSHQLMGSVLLVLTHVLPLLQPITYKIQDLDGETIHGSFYSNELQKSNLLKEF